MTVSFLCFGKQNPGGEGEGLESRQKNPASLRSGLSQLVPAPEVSSLLFENQAPKLLFSFLFFSAV